MLAQYESGVCECGFHESLTGDLSNHFTFDVKVCNVCKASAQFARVQGEEDEQHLKTLGEKPPAVTPRLSDGRKTHTRMTGTVEQWRANRSPSSPAPR